MKYDISDSEHVTYYYYYKNRTQGMKLYSSKNWPQTKY